MSHQRTLVVCSGVIVGLSAVATYPSLGILPTDNEALVFLVALLSAYATNKDVVASLVSALVVLHLWKRSRAAQSAGHVFL